MHVNVLLIYLFPVYALHVYAARQLIMQCMNDKFNKHSYKRHINGYTERPLPNNLILR